MGTARTVAATGEQSTVGVNLSQVIGEVGGEVDQEVAGGELYAGDHLGKVAIEFLFRQRRERGTDNRRGSHRSQR